MPSLPQPLLHAQLQLPLQLRTRLLAMDKIAEPTSHATFPAIESTARLSEIRHGRKLAIDGAGGVPAGVEGVTGGLRRVLIFEARVDIADEVCGAYIRLAILFTMTLVKSSP